MTPNERTMNVMREAAVPMALMIPLRIRYETGLCLMLRLANVSSMLRPLAVKKRTFPPRFPVWSASERGRSTNCR